MNSKAGHLSPFQALTIVAGIVAVIASGIGLIMLVFPAPPDHFEFKGRASIGTPIGTLIENYGEPENEIVDNDGNKRVFYETLMNLGKFTEIHICEIVLDEADRISSFKSEKRPRN